MGRISADVEDTAPRLRPPARSPRSRVGSGERSLQRATAPGTATPKRCLAAVCRLPWGCRVHVATLGAGGPAEPLPPPAPSSSQRPAPLSSYSSLAGFFPIPTPQGPGRGRKAGPSPPGCRQGGAAARPGLRDGRARARLQPSRGCPPEATGRPRLPHSRVAAPPPSRPRAAGPV